MLFIILVTVVLLFAMTTAWYTNVVQTQGLTFQAETWGFDGSVTISDEPIRAVPGDEGIIGINITNNSEDASALTVNITKEYMDPQQLQQRIYFYADETVMVNGEQVQRQYLSNTSGYTYELAGKNTLVLSDQVCTDVPLKWQWVYDLVGYYFLGTVDEGVVTASEFLRPVEYDYYNAQYDEEGNLTMVDKETTVEAFLQTLTQTDGYPGSFQIQTDENTQESILVDESGNNVQTRPGYYCIREQTAEEPGLWIYLCTLAEIEKNTSWDTTYVTQAENRQFAVRITLTGTQIQKEITALTDPATLETVLNSSDGKIVQLQQNMTLTEGVELNQNVDVVLDLNGHTVSYSGDDPAFQVTTGGALTVTNGALTGDNASVAFRSVGGHVTMSNLDITDVFTALKVEDYMTTDEQGANSVIRIVDCKLRSNDDTVVICGDGLASAGRTLLVIQNSTLESKTYAGILGKGNSVSPSQWGTDIQIIDSTVSGYYTGIYHPMQQSSLTVSGSTIRGMTGIAMKGGDLTVIDSTVSGIGTTDLTDPATAPNLSGSGWMDTGDGIYVESDYGYPVTVSVSGQSYITCAAVTARAVRVYPAADHVQVELTGGTYSTDVSSYLPQGYTLEPTADGYKVLASSEETQ